MRAATGVVAAGAVLRLVAVVGITPTVYVDSGEYRDIAFFGGERRPWAVPLLHSLVGDATARVVAHAVIGAAAWGVLALVVAAALEHRVVRVVAAVAVMGMGVTTPVTNYDTTITSETVAVSLAVLLLAAALHLAARPSTRRVLALLAVAVPFAFTRNDHPVLVAAAAVVAVAVAARVRRQPSTVLAVGLSVLAVWSVAAWRRNDEIERFNLAMVVANRVLPDDRYLAWFLDHGMPLPDGADTLDLADDPAWDRWAGEEGTRTYGLFLLTHPDHLLLEPWPDLFGLRSTSLEAAAPTTVLVSPADRYGRVHAVVPEPVEAVLFAPGNAGAVLIGLVGCGVVASLAIARDGPGRARARLGPARAVAAAAVVVAAGHLYLVWHASPIELGRLAMVPATTLHVATLVLVAVTADRAATKSRQ